jgi:GMP synthase (glutamine-hydrolysing)
MSLNIAVLQHVACEPPGSYSSVLEKYGVVDSFLLCSGEVPVLDTYDAIVAMGGPMGAYEVEQFPWLDDEVNALRRALRSGVAVWGVCLGAQLLAAAAGAQVILGPSPEVGVGTVKLTSLGSKDSVFGGLPLQFPVLQWHQDTFDLPDGAELLAISTAYQNQAFRLGNSYGLQFHLEAPWDLAEEWLEIEAYRLSLSAAAGSEGATRLREEMLGAQASMLTLAEMLMVRWLDALSND